MEEHEEAQRMVLVSDAKMCIARHFSRRERHAIPSHQPRSSSLRHQLVALPVVIVSLRRKGGTL